MNRLNGILKLFLLISLVLLLPVVQSVEAYQDAGHGSINDADWAALQSIYSQMTPFGQENSGWAAEGTPCDTPWQGVSCENGAVVKLEFDQVDFFCSIPEAVTQLNNLREIRMTNMLLRGIVPENLFSLPNLQAVTFSHNLLTGPFPQSTSQTLQVLVIEDNKWTDQKQQELSNRPNLSLCESVVQYPPERQINMDPGLDGGIPATLGYFPSLYKIDLSGNMLEGNIPAELNNLYSLGSIDLSDNHPQNPLTVTDEALTNKLQAIGDKNLDGVRLPILETNQQESMLQTQQAEEAAIAQQQTQQAYEAELMVFQQQTQQAYEAEMMVFQQQTQQAYEAAVAQQQTQQAYEAAVAQQQTQQAYEAAVAQQQTQQAYEAAVAQQQTQQAYEAAVAQQQTQQAYEAAVAQQQTQQAYEAAVAQQQTQQAYEAAVAQQQTQQAYEAAVAQQQTQQAYEAVVAQQQTQQAYEVTVAQQQTQQAYEAAVAQQQTQQANEAAAAQQQTQQALNAEGTSQAQAGLASVAQTETASVPSATVSAPTETQPAPTETAVASTETPQPSPTTPPSFVGVNEQELQNITRIFNRMTPYWQQKSNWFKTFEVCDWDGIDCDSEGFVTNLALDSENYFCSIPAEVSRLSHLKELSMTNMLLMGTIPAEVLNIPTLEKLDLSGNLLTGPLPQLTSSAALKYLSVADNRTTSAKQADLLNDVNKGYCDFVNQDLSKQEIDTTPGLDGSIPESWFGFGFMEHLDLSGNTLSGEIPASFAYVAGLRSLTYLNLSNNTGREPLSVVDMRLAEALVMNTGSILDGVQFPAPATATPTSTATFTATPVPPTATATFTTQPGQPSNTPAPTQTPTSTFTPVPTATLVPASPTPYPLIIVVMTATPRPTMQVWVTSTPIRWVTATPIPWYTSTPIYYWSYRTATPAGQYYPPIWNYPTAQPRPTYGYTYPTAVYPTASSGNVYPIWTPYVPQATVTPTPTINPATLFEFNYVSEKMTADNLPMTWKYTGMKDYMINYLTKDNTLYPGFAMEWTDAAKICNASTCTFDIQSIPDQLLKGGSFYVQLQARDGGGRIFQSSPIGLQVAGQPVIEGSATPAVGETPESRPNFIVRFFRWLFGPIIRLFE